MFGGGGGGSGALNSINQLFNVKFYHMETCLGLIKCHAIKLINQGFFLCSQGPKFCTIPNGI